MNLTTIDPRTGCSRTGMIIVLALFYLCGCNGQSDSHLINGPHPMDLPPKATGAHTNWPNFRGPNYDSETDHSMPTQWSAEKGIKWMSELPGRGASSPVRFDDQIILTSYSGYGVDANNPGELSDLRHHVLSISAESGELQWQRDIAGTALLQKMNPELARHGFASSTPVTDGEYVFAWFGVSGLFAFDMKGELLWQRNLGLETHYFGSSASPVLFDDLVIVNASIEFNTVYGLNKKTGAVVWEINSVFECWSMPVIGYNADGKPEMIVSSKNVLAGYDPKTGKQLWHCAGILDYVVSIPIVVDSIVYLTGGKEKQMMAVRLGGSGDVEATHKLWETKTIGANVTSPVLRDGRLFVFHDNGILQVIDASNGELKHRQRTATKTQPFSSPLLVGENLYMPFQDAGIGIYSADDECREIVLNKFPDDSPLMASITPGDACFWIRSDRFLYCVDGATETTSKNKLAEANNGETITAKGHYNLEVEKGWTRRYLLFMTKDQAEIVKYLLMPYQSIITDEQTELATAIAAEQMPKYLELLERFREVQYQDLYSPAKQAADFDEAWRQLETDTDKLNNDIRILVKKLFTPEQMEKHSADAKAGKAHIKPQ